ncbi:UV DNA damage repair endonuclease UvsE [Paraclostridium ghonii]|uniref:UV DNA damage repair endonuclease UvsE n=1 Tax=Paraclostridium ghonii TaxID=29358 RepID=UPI00202CE47E|nr:UV DNA damage repair endonuclease UvsE [Paeniclostridium ghonii]MCM0167218.1 UV DNA damage repair endonuclease UvsE [Paeniclostridium ghonii]
MRIRLGYVAIALNLPKVTSSSTITYSRYSKISTEAERLNKLKEVTRSNIYDLEKILNYNVENQIHFYRLTSNLIPLGTHPDVSFNYRKYFKKDFEYIGNLIKKSNMRVDSHPDQFNVINSIKDSVVENTIKSLKFQSQIFEDINYEEGKMIIHIGSSQGGKEEGKKRFIDNLKYFPDEVVNKLILENDDKVFTAQDVLDICKETKLPMVLDVHHHICKNNEEEIKYMLKDIFDTWNEEVLPPKIHFSSPREFEKDRKHADFINPKEFLNFVYLAKQELNRDFDVMIEAKKKDLALKQLVYDIKNLDEKIKFIDNTTIEI